MNPWVVLALFVGWTSAVWYYGDQHGAARATKAHDKAVAAAEAGKAKAEADHAEAGRKFEEYRKHDREYTAGLEAELAQLGHDKPLPAVCRLGPERVRVWNKANAGPAPLPGEPAGAVRDPAVPAVAK